MCAGASYLNEGKLHELSYFVVPPHVGLHMKDSQPSPLQLLQDVQHAPGAWLLCAAVLGLSSVTLLAVQLHLRVTWHCAGLGVYSTSLRSSYIALPI